MSILVETDARKRISLAKLGVDDTKYYLAECRADGSILLRPAEVRPKVMDIVERAHPDWEETLVNETDVKPSAEWERVREGFIADNPDVLEPPAPTE